MVFILVAYQEHGGAFDYSRVTQAFTSSSSGNTISKIIYFNQISHSAKFLSAIFDCLHHTLYAIAATAFIPTTAASAVAYAICGQLKIAGTNFIVIDRSKVRHPIRIFYL